MKTKIQNILFTLLLLFFSSGYLKAIEINATHFRSGIFGTPPKQYEFKNSSLRGLFTSFPLDSIRKALGDEDFNKINIDYWIYSSIEDVEMAMVEKLELTDIDFKNSIDFPLADGSIGINCWYSFEESGTVLFSWNNAMVFISPKNENSFDPKIIEESAREIESVLKYTNREGLTDFEKVVPAINNFFYTYYPLNWEDSVKIRIEATDPQNEKLFYRKYGDNYDSFSEDSIISTTLNKNTDSIDTYNNKIKVWVWNEDHIVTSAKQRFYFMIYPGKYVLTENDLPGCDFIREDIYTWLVDKTSYNNGIEHTWNVPDTANNEHINIFYFEFDNEHDAILGTSNDAHSYSAPFYFGSPNGEFTGNISYVGGSSAYSLQKWNIGFKIYAPSTFDDNNQFGLIELSKKILKKINDSIPESYLRKDIELKQNQILENEYNQLTENATTLLTKRNFTTFKTDDTKWIHSEDSLIMGLRKQWVNEKSRFTIDVVKLSDALEAKKVGKKRDTISYSLSPFCWLNNKDSIDLAFEKLSWYFSYPNQFISATGVNDNYAIFFHYQDKDSIDFEFFKSVLKSFADNGTSVENIKQNDLKIYPNPANETVTIETQITEITFAKLLDSTGRLIKTLPIENGANTYHISELESGVYFIQVPQKEKMVVKKIVKN